MHQVVCIALFARRKLGHVQLRDNVLAYAGGTPGFKTWVEAAIARIKAQGAFVRVEHLSEGEIGVGMQRVEPSDQNYLSAVAETFEAQGFWARVYAPKQAEIWRYLHLFPVDEEIKTAILPVLHAITEEQADELLQLFVKTEKKLAGANPE